MQLCISFRDTLFPFREECTGSQNLVGLLLGDLWAEKRGDNTRFRFKGICHKDYLFHLYELFADFCPQIPKNQTVTLSTIE